MPSSGMGSCRIITIFSLVALSILSFTVLFGVDTLTQDTFVPPKSNLVHHRRAFHHARASAPVSVSESNSLQSDPTPSSKSAPSPAVVTQASSASLSSPLPSSQPAQTSSAHSSSIAASTSPATSAAATSSSSLRPSSSSPSPSSSSLSSASSSQGVTSSPIAAVSSTASNPGTPLVKGMNSYTSGFSPTATGSTLTIAASATGTGSASGFLKNKAAVGATFGIIGIVGGLAAIMAVLAILKRHRRTREAIENEEFFEKYQGGDFGGEPTPPGFGTTSLSASEMDVNTTAASPDAYPDRAIHYGQSNSGTVLNPVDYGIAYPPSAADDNSTSATRSGNMFEDVELSHSSSHPFADPANVSFATAAPQVTYSRPTPGRAQEMVAIDSYYGLNSAGVGAGGMGYAQ